MKVQLEVSFTHKATKDEAIEQAKAEFIKFVEDCEITAEVSDVDKAPDATITYFLVTFSDED